MVTTIIKASGILDGAKATALVAEMSAGTVYTIDFSEVTDINFAALRILLRCRQSGMSFAIINACDEVAAKFEDSGVSTFINISRKARKLDINQYSAFGEGYLSKALNSADGDSMLKLYGPMVAKDLVIREKMIARAVLRFGLNTPLAGAFYEHEDCSAIDFERIEGKRSFSRIISEEPERLEEITVRFAKMCKQLHSTQCDTAMFDDRIFFYRNAVAACKDISDELKAKAMEFIDNVPAETTCLHGDLQLSNIINDGKDDYWIDLADFGYGYHMLDLGMWYFLSKLNPERLTQHIFHLSKAQMDRIWDIFVREYFGAESEAQKEEVQRMVEPYAALHMIYLGSTFGFEPGMTDYIAHILL